MVRNETCNLWTSQGSPVKSRLRFQTAKRTRSFIVLCTVYALFIQCLPIQCLDFDLASCRCEKHSQFNKPFVVLWNSPTEGCHVNFSVNIELEKFGILTNTNQTWDGEVVTVFYNAQLGLYPYFYGDNLNQSFNGGMPQLINITKHLLKSSQDIAVKIPDPDFKGVAVIDWEGWRPLWETNFGKKRIYQTKSIELIQNENVFKTNGNLLKKNVLKNEIANEAKRRFEKAARQMMEETIKLGRKLRPKALWGFYGFPGCHGNLTTGFRCTEQNKQWNNKIQWLYASSTALFPSIYLMEEHVQNHKFVEERLSEAFRVSLLMANNTTLPVLPYLRPLYQTWSHQFKMLNEDDLENAIGQAADLGCAGLILWGNHYDERTSKAVCTRYNNYVNKKLGPYISSLTEELETCSKEKCSSNGRCIDRSPMDLFNNELNVKKDSCSLSTVKHTVFSTGRKVLQKNNSGHQVDNQNISFHETGQPSTKSRIKNKEKKRKDVMLTRNGTKKVELKKLQSNISRMNSKQRAHPDKDKYIKTLSNSTMESLSTEQLGGHKTLRYNSVSNKTNQNQRTLNRNVTLGSNNSTLPVRSKSVGPTHPGGNRRKHIRHKFSYVKTKPHDNLLPEVTTGKSNSDVDELNLIEICERKQLPLDLLATAKEGNSTTEKIWIEVGKHLTTSEVDRNPKLSNNASSYNHKEPKSQERIRKRGYSATGSDETAVRIPSVYIILITVTLGGALLMTVIYVAIYYAVNVRGRSHDHTYDNNFGSNEDNPFSIDDHDGQWWDDNIDQKEKLLNRDNKR